jgi:hypothetical protein
VARDEDRLSRLTPYLELAVSCPHCGRRPPVRVYPAERDRYSHDDPDRRVLSIICRQCGTRYDVTSVAFQQAG